MKEEQNILGQAEHRMQVIIRDMTRGALSALASHSIILPDKSRTELQRLIHGYAMDSTELLAAIMIIVETLNAPEVA